MSGNCTPRWSARASAKQKREGRKPRSQDAPKRGGTCSHRPLRALADDGLYTSGIRPEGGSRQRAPGASARALSLSPLFSRGAHHPPPKGDSPWRGSLARAWASSAAASACPLPDAAASAPPPDRDAAGPGSSVGPETTDGAAERDGASVKRSAGEALASSGSAPAARSS